MRSGKGYRSILSLSIILLLILASGCSKLSPLDSNSETNPSDVGSVTYPMDLDDLIQNGPAPGYSVLTMEQPENAMGVENWDYAEMWMDAFSGGSLYTAQGSGVQIIPGALPYDTLVTVTLPYAGFATQSHSGRGTVGAFSILDNHVQEASLHECKR